jgi:hypothetical protein
MDIDGDASLKTGIAFLKTWIISQVSWITS